MLVSYVSMCGYRSLRPADHSFRGVPPGVKGKGKTHRKTGHEGPDGD